MQNKWVLKCKFLGGEFAKRNFFYYLCTWKWESWKEYQKNTMKNQAKTIFVN